MKPEGLFLSAYVALLSFAFVGTAAAADSKPVPPAAINDQGSLYLRVDANDGTIS